MTRHGNGSTGRPRRLPRAFPLGALAAALLLLPGCGRKAPPAGGSPVVAEVGDERITADDVRREAALRRGLPGGLSPAGGGALRPEVEEALRRLVEEAFVVAEGRRRGVSVTEGEVEAEVSRHRNDFPPGGLEKALARAGLDPAAWRDGVRRSLLHRKAAESIVASLPPPAPSAAEGEGRGGSGEAGRGREPHVKVRELVFATRGEASSARELVAAGRSPAAAASLAAGKVAPTSVSLGWFPVSALPPGVPEGVGRLPRGGASEVVSFAGGYAVFVAEERREAGDPVPAAGEGVAAAEAAREEALRRWLEDARGRTKVRIDEEQLSALYAGRP